jgi:hypothetical protein
MTDQGLADLLDQVQKSLPAFDPPPAPGLGPDLAD